MSENLDIQPQPASVTPVTDSAPVQENTEQVEKSPAEQSAVEGATTSDEAQQDEARKKSGFQKRIDELTRQRYERDATIENLQARLNAIEQQNLQVTAEATKPSIEQFDYDHEAWAKAYSQWVDNQQTQKEKKAQEQQQQAILQQQQMVQQQRLQEKIYEAQAKYPDFMQTINDPSLPNLQEINRAAYDAVLDSDNMGAVAMHLAKNPEKVYSFASMSPVQAIREVAKLEMMLDQGKPQNPRPTPPPPATDIRGTSDVSVNPKTMDTATYIKWRNEQLMKR